MVIGLQKNTFSHKYEKNWLFVFLSAFILTLFPYLSNYYLTKQVNKTYTLIKTGLKTTIYSQGSATKAGAKEVTFASDTCSRLAANTYQIHGFAV